MKTHMVIGARVGGAIGLCTALLFGIFPGFYFGSYGAIILLSKLTGPVTSGLFTRIFVAISALVGILTIVSITTVTFAMLGACLGYLSNILERKEGCGFCDSADR